MVLKTMKTSVEFSYLPAIESVDSNVVWSKIAIGKDHVWFLRVYQYIYEMNIEFTEIQNNWWKCDCYSVLVTFSPSVVNLCD